MSYLAAGWVLCGLTFFLGYEAKSLRACPKAALFWFPVSLAAGPFMWLMLPFM